MNCDPKIRSRLEAELAKLQPRLAEIERGIRAEKPRDSEERATESENDEVLDALDVTTRERIAEIREALARCDAGTHGTCTRCGTTISTERLEALPWAALCRACAG